ncbi:hypothetical protein IG197_19600 [Aminobacter sp. SR38]|uniref:hypothetical protein n=1 Tax=Aminobacter sp. SR38 TaxID=2774562 RepID=UPI00177E0C1E|nr:hypothetical protein [Aminobacter sp. SR38]QOF70031.1 hypothetical protein IG197_19600 [Aminobacter sp. SR38]
MNLIWLVPAEASIEPGLDDLEFVVADLGNTLLEGPQKSQFRHSDPDLVLLWRPDTGRRNGMPAEARRSGPFS